MSECFGVKIEAEGLNEARLEDVRDALCTEWDIEEDEVHFEPQPNRTAKMVAVTAGGPNQMESETEFSERIALAIWRANRTFCPVCVRIEDAANVRAFCERDYGRVIKQGDSQVQYKAAMNFIFGLFDGDELIDQTSLDENSQSLAEELFFGEFGHKREPGMAVRLLKSLPEENPEG